jgi:uncharacterized protein YwqG
VRPHATVSPFPASVTEFAESLATLGLAAHAEALTQQARDAIRCRFRAAAERAIEPGGSKVGGSPDLPPEVSWPAGPDAVPLSFLVQFNLAEVPVADDDGLPREGLLSFFYDSVRNPFGDQLDDLGRCRVLYSPGPPWERRAQPLVDGERVADEFEVGRPRYERYLSVPSFPELLDPDEADRYGAAFASAEPVTKLLGRPDEIQDPMEGCCERLSRGLSCLDAPPLPADDLAVARREWSLLLQLDCEPVPNMTWGSGSGRLYFWIRRRDLAECEFHHALALVQDT